MAIISTRSWSKPGWQNFSGRIQKDTANQNVISTIIFFLLQCHIFWNKKWKIIHLTIQKIEHNAQSLLFSVFFDISDLKDFTD